MTEVVTRFAPSPSGHLHVGGARTALYCWAFARGHKGRLVLRIEDTDQKRRSDSATTGFMRDLNWLGIAWDEGPLSGSNGGGDRGPYLQSQRLEIYTEVLEGLVAHGKAYHAFDTAEQLEVMRAEARSTKERVPLRRGIQAPLTRRCRQACCCRRGFGDSVPLA